MVNVPSKVIIVGAGLGGLACAIACRRQGLQVDILERAPVISNVGAGIQVPPNSARVLEKLQLLSKIQSVSTTVDHLEMKRYSNGQSLCKKPMGPVSMREYGAPWMVIHREDYHKVLLQAAIDQGATLTLDACVTAVDASGTKVTLANGSVHQADVVVGADGLWSTIRECLLKKPSPPQETGDLAYRATFSLDRLKELQDPRVDELCAQKAVILWMGPERHSVFYPLRAGTEFNLVLLRPDNLPPGVRTAQGDVSEMRASFEGWDETLTKLLSCISSVLKWKLVHHAELETWTKGNAVLLGDACHPTLPYQAQGAAMAVEDGAVLGYLLGAYKKSVEAQHADAVAPSLSSVIQLYEILRKQRTTLNVQGAEKNRWFYHMPDGKEQEERDLEMQNYDFKNGRSEYSWLDSRYQDDLLGYDVLSHAEQAYGEWWAREVHAANSGSASDNQHDHVSELKRSYL